MDQFIAHTPAQLGAIVRGFRQELGLSQAELAAQVGVTQKVISRFELHPEKISVGGLYRLLAGLKLDLLLKHKGAAKKRADW